MIRSINFVHPGGCFFSCNLTSTFLKCFVTLCHLFPEAKCGQFVTWFLDTFVMSCRLLSKMWTLCHMFFDTSMMFSWLRREMWTFCRMISGHICDILSAIKRNVDVLSHDLFYTFITSSQLLSKTWHSLTWFFGHISNVQLAFKQNVDVLPHVFWTHLWWGWWFWTHLCWPTGC